MRTLHLSILLLPLAIGGRGFAADDKLPDGDPHRVFLVVDQSTSKAAAFAPWAKEMMTTLTKERPLIERPAFGGFTAIKGESPKTMYDDAIKKKAGQIFHVTMLESTKDKTKKTTLSAQYTIYEPKKDADPEKPAMFWQKAAGEKVKATAPMVDPEAIAARAGAGQVLHDEYEMLAVELFAALVKRMAAAKGIEGKVTDKSTLTVTVSVFNAGKTRIRGVVLAIPQDDYVKYCPGKADVAPGETQKVTFTFKDPAANKLAWKTGKLVEVYVDHGK
jgi:hypothetical protein